MSAWLLKHRVCKVNPFLAASSFLVYVAHSLIFVDLFKLLFKLLKPVTGIGILSVLLLAVAVAVALLLLTSCLLRRYAPSFLEVIAGRK